MSTKSIYSHIHNSYKKYTAFVAIPFVLASMLTPTIREAKASTNNFFMKNNPYQRQEYNSIINRNKQPYILKPNSISSSNSFSNPSSREASPPYVDNRIPATTNATIFYTDDYGNPAELWYYGYANFLQAFHNYGNKSYDGRLFAKDFYVTMEGSGSIYVHSRGGTALLYQGVNRIAYHGTRFGTFNIYMYQWGTLFWNIELYTGKIETETHSNINSLGAMRIAIRGATTGTQGSQGLELKLSGNVNGAIQGTSVNDTVILREMFTMRHASLLNGQTSFISLGNGNDRLTIQEQTESGVQILNGGSIYMGAGNDTIYLSNYASLFNIEGSIYMGSGNDYLSIAQRNSGERSKVNGIFMESGNNSVILQAGNSNSSIQASSLNFENGNNYLQINTQLRVHTSFGNGNNLVDINTADLSGMNISFGNGDNLIKVNSGAGQRLQKDFSLGNGNNTITTLSGSIYQAGTLTTQNGGSITLTSTNGKFIINSIVNNGTFILSLGTTQASYQGPTNIAQGKVSIHLYDRAALASDITSGAGNDTYLFENVDLNYNIYAKGGNNSIRLTNTNSTKAIGASGNDTIIGRNSTVQSLLMEQGETKNIDFLNVRVNQNLVSTASRNTLLLHHTVIRGSLITGGNDSIEGLALQVNNINLTGGLQRVALTQSSVTGGLTIAGRNSSVSLQNTTINNDFRSTGIVNTTITNSTVRGTFSTAGNDTILAQNSTLGNLELLSSAYKKIKFSNVQIGGSNGFLMNNTATSTIELYNNLNFTNSASRFKIIGGRHILILENLNMTGNLVDIDIDTAGNNTLNMNGNIRRAGNIYLGEGSNSVLMTTVTTYAGSFGVIEGGLLNDSMFLTAGTNFRGGLNFRNATGTGDTLHLNNSTIASGSTIAYAGKFNLIMNGTSQTFQDFIAVDETNFTLTNSSIMNSAVHITTNKLVNIDMFDTSRITKDITVENTVALKLQIDAENQASLASDIISGNLSDYISINIIDNANFSGRILTNDGADSVNLNMLSTNSSIQSLDVGAGNDSVQLIAGTFAGSTNFILGTGDNTLRFMNNIIINNDIIIREVSNATNTFLFNENSTVTSSFFTGNVRADFILERGTHLTGQINASAVLNIEMKNNSTLIGNILPGNGNSILRITDSLIDGSIENNKGGELEANITNSTISGTLISTSPQTTLFNINGSTIQQDVRTHSVNFTGASNIFNRNIVIVGESNINLASSEIQGVFQSEGNSTLVFDDVIFGQDINIAKGVQSVNITGGSVHTNITLNQVDIVLTTNNTIINGDINLLPALRPDAKNLVGNTLNINGGSIGGSVLASRNGENNVFRFRNTNIAQNIAIGVGSNSIHAKDSTIGGDIIFQGTTTTVLDNISITGILDFRSRALGDQNLTIIGKAWNQISLSNVNNTLALTGLVLNTTTDIALQGNSKNDLIVINQSLINGSINLETGGEDSLYINNSSIKGDIISPYIAMSGRVSMMQNSPNISSSFTIGQNNKDIYFQHSNLHITPGRAGDTVNFYSNIRNTGGAITLDVDFITGEHDTVIIKSQTRVYGDTKFLLINPLNLFTGNEVLLDNIQDVLIAESPQSFERIPSLINIYMAAGGNLYKIEPSEDKLYHFDLRLAGENPLNYGYAAMALSSRNYTRSFLESVDQQSINSILNTSKQTSNYGKQNFSDHVAMWINASVSVNEVSSPLSPDINETLVIGTVGLEIKEIDINKTDRFGLQVFGGYGYSSSKYKTEQWDFKGTLNAYSAGMQFQWVNLRGDERYRFFIKSTTWIDIYKNDLSNPITFSPESWSSSSINATLGVGYIIKQKRFMFVPEVEAMYSHFTGANFIAADESLIEFKKANQILMKISATAAYLSSIGLKPYIRLALEIPTLLVPENANGAFIAGKQYDYNVDDVLTRIGLGLNYSISISGLDISTYIDASMHLGRENGVRGNFGFALGF